MKKFTIAFLVLVGLNANAQNFEYNYNFDMVLYTLNDFQVPKDLEGSVQSMVENTKYKKTEYKAECKFNAQVEETIERMKIAISQMQEYLEGKRDSVYYWQFEDEQYDS